jgi:hypothetical protein
MAAKIFMDFQWQSRGKVFVFYFLLSAIEAFDEGRAAASGLFVYAKLGVKLAAYENKIYGYRYTKSCVCMCSVYLSNVYVWRGAVQSSQHIARERLFCTCSAKKRE